MPSSRALLLPWPRTIFVGAVAAFSLTWLFGLSLRAPIATVPLFNVRNAGLSRVIGNDFTTLVEVVVVLLLAVAAYLTAVWALHRGFRHSFAFAIGGSIVAACAVLPQMPFFSPDTVHFAADVRTLWLHNTYPASRAGVPSRQDDPIADQVRTYRSAPSSYGPVAYVIGGAPLPFVGDSLRANIFGQKALSATFLVAIAVVAGLIARRIGRDPGLATGLVGLNPMFLMQFAGDGHNDTIMVFFAIVALYLVIAPRWRTRWAGVPVAMLSALSKFSLVMTAPLIAAWWIPRYRVVLAGLFLVGSISLLAALIIVRGYGANGPLIGVTENTPYWVVFQLFEPDRDQRRAMVIGAYVLLFALTSTLMAFHRMKEPADIVAAVGLQLWLFVFLLSPTMRHWYQIWAFPFAILAGRRWLTAGAIAFSCGAFLPLLGRNWTISIGDDLGLDRPKEYTVLALWMVTALIALAVWLLEKPPTRSTPPIPETEPEDTTTAELILAQ